MPELAGRSPDNWWKEKRHGVFLGYKRRAGLVGAAHPRRAVSILLQ